MSNIVVLWLLTCCTCPFLPFCLSTMALSRPHPHPVPLSLQAIFELLRYVTITPYLIPHKATQDGELGGYDVPKGAMVRNEAVSQQKYSTCLFIWFFHRKHLQVWCDQFSMNHDPEYWDDPWTFNPERFLDGQGQLVGVDHPNRRR